MGKSWYLRTAHFPGFHIHGVCSEVMEAEKTVDLERVFMLKESRGKGPEGCLFHGLLSVVLEACVFLSMVLTLPMLSSRPF